MLKESDSAARTKGPGLKLKPHANPKDNGKDFSASGTHANPKGNSEVSSLWSPMLIREATAHLFAFGAVSDTLRFTKNGHRLRDLKSAGRWNDAGSSSVRSDGTRRDVAF